MSCIQPPLGADVLMDRPSTLRSLSLQPHLLSISYHTLPKVFLCPKQSDDPVMIIAVTDSCDTASFLAHSSAGRLGAAFSLSAMLVIGRTLFRRHMAWPVQPQLSLGFAVSVAEVGRRKALGSEYVHSWSPSPRAYSIAI